ncbi:hypothetical protein IID23_04535 [Patescibacteria group bacterium]|nr:hypothetical protein [Patescibacteria group bacterium]
MNIFVQIITSEEIFKAAKTAAIALMIFGYVLFLRGSMDIAIEEPKGIQISIGVEHPLPEK